MNHNKQNQSYIILAPSGTTPVTYILVLQHHNLSRQNQPYKILAPSDITSVTNMVVLNIRTTIGFNNSDTYHWQFHLP